MSDSLKSILMETRMRWLGQVWRMDDNRQPKRLLKPRPFHGTKQCWRDVVNTDLKSLNIRTTEWLV